MERRSSRWARIASLGQDVAETLCVPLQVHGVQKDVGAWKVCTLHQTQECWTDDSAMQNWQIKGLAIVQSSFREVLSLDSGQFEFLSHNNLPLELG